MIMYIRADTQTPLRGSAPESCSTWAKVTPTRYITDGSVNNKSINFALSDAFSTAINNRINFRIWNVPDERMSFRL